MGKYRLQKTESIAKRLKKLQRCEDETLKQVSEVILEKLDPIPLLFLPPQSLSLIHRGSNPPDTLLRKRGTEK